MSIKYSITIFTLFIFQFSFGQGIIDSCFTSVSPSVNFTSSTNLANMGPDEADVIEWTGTAWTGGWSHANLTIPPPTNVASCRAIFIGNAITWTGGGEGFAVRLNSPLIAGHSYAYTFNYVSHGVGSNGAFSPAFFTNSSTSSFGSFVGNLPPVGNTWTTNTVSFTATAAQSGDTWLIITTATSGSSGLINSFCKTCNDPSAITCNVNLGKDTTLCEGQTLTLQATTPNATYLWQDHSSNSTFQVTQQGLYWVEVTSNTCTERDTITINYNPKPQVDLGNDTTWCSGNSITLDATTANATYLWQNQSSLPTLLVTHNGTYSVKVTVNHCSATDDIVIRKGNCETALELPNLITPNHDGSNDAFVPIISKGIVSMETSVYNCWGAKVLETKNLLIEWDARNVSDGVYYWVIHYEDINGLTNTINGYLTILR